MESLHLELDELEIDSLELLPKAEDEYEYDLDSMMIGHGMLEIGASCNKTGTCSDGSCTKINVVRVMR